MTEQDLNYLRSAIEKGNVTLFLGAGASMGSLNSQGMPLMSTREFSEALANECQFNYENESLGEVYAAAKQVLGSSQLSQYLDRHFRYCTPSSEYAILARFPWARIYTTNIDDAFENALNKSTIDCPQHVRVQTRKSRFIDRDQTYSSVDLIKLHGSVHRLEDGVIFSSEEYSNEAASPSPWYSQIGYDYQNYSFLIIGSTLREPVLFQQVQYARQKIQETSPQSFLVIPHISELQKRAFIGSNIFHIPWKLTEFVSWLEGEFPDGLSYTEVATNNNPSIRKLLSGKRTDMVRLAEVLSDVVQIKQPDMRSKDLRTGQIRNFYRGFKPCWKDIADGVPAYTDDISKLTETIQQALNSQVQCVVVYGPAGSGKSTATRMAAMEITKKLDIPCFFTQGTNESISDALIELEKVHRDRYILICDRLEPCVELIVDTLHHGKCRKALILAVESQHVWSDRVKEKLEEISITEFNITKISESDAVLILGKLEEFGPWTRLAQLTSNQRTRLLIEKSKRQLLIGLLEATQGIGYEEIIRRDYRNLRSDNHRILLVVVGLASMHRLYLPIIYAARILEKLGVRQYPAELLGAMEGVVTNTQGKLFARHPIYVRSLLEIHISTNELGNIIKQLLHVFTIYDTPVIKSVSKNENLLYKKTINNRFLRSILRNNEPLILDIYRSLEKYFEQDGLYWVQYGLALRHFGHQESALDKLRTAVIAHEQAHTLHAYAHQQLIVALRETDDGRSEQLAEEAKVTLEKLQYSQNSIGYRDVYPIIVLAKGYTAFIRKAQGENFARIIAKGYADRIYELRKKRTDRHLDETWNWLTSYAVRGKWKPPNFSDLVVEEDF